MSFRTVFISNRAKLELKLNYLVVRNDEVIKIHLSEISTLVVESTAVSITAMLIAELVKRKIKVIFCYEKRNPLAELMPYYGSHDTSNKVRMQIAWEKHAKEATWTKIVSEKILKQRDLLMEIGLQEAELLHGYVLEIEHFDVTNREGHAAKVYFNALFGLDFVRTAQNPVNAALNYGYGILLSAFSREIVSNGYITQIGIFHDNVFNQFNLACDFMEPFRPLIDEIVVKLMPEKLEREEKLELVNVLNKEVIICGQRQFVNNAIKIYCKNILDALSMNDLSLIRFYTK